jgi:hypothetical protein
MPKYYIFMMDYEYQTKKGENLQAEVHTGGLGNLYIIYEISQNVFVCEYQLNNKL